MKYDIRYKKPYFRIILKQFFFQPVLFLSQKYKFKIKKKILILNGKRLYPEKVGFWVWLLGWLLYSNPNPKIFIPKTQNFLYPNPKPKNIYTQNPNPKILGTNVWSTVTAKVIVIGLFYTKNSLVIVIGHRKF